MAGTTDSTDNAGAVAQGHRSLYHTGIVVRDLAAAMRDFSDATGIRWREAGSMVVPVSHLGEDLDIPFSAVYSLDGPHYLELVQEVPGTVWVCPGDGHVHHLGYWTDDLETTAAELERQEFTRVASSTMGGDRLVFTYHRRGTGPLIEHVSTSIRSLVFGEA
jgi:Glyoxalase/Bleomycin resistance protein/Dioxygenase superfamily